MSGAALAVERLAAPFGDQPGLDGIDFTVDPGRRLVIAGASGAGKTTLLRAIAGLGPVTGGRVLVRGRDVTARPAEARDVVYLHQTPLLFPHLSVLENVAFPLRVRRMPDAEVRARAAHALELVQLGGLGSRPPRALSGGQRHRVALARALVARPAVLLLDEPLASLDPTLRDEVRGAILQLQAEYGAALVVVTHDLDEAALLADRIGVLLERRLAQLAPPGELFRQPASLAVARFLGIPNALPGRVHGDGTFECALGRIAPDGAALRPGPAVAVFRPEALAVADRGAIRARIVEIRHRVRDTTAIALVGETPLEVRIDPARMPAPGAIVALELHPGSVTVLEG